MKLQDELAVLESAKTALILNSAENLYFGTAHNGIYYILHIVVNHWDTIYKVTQPGGLLVEIGDSSAGVPTPHFEAAQKLWAMARKHWEDK